LDVVAARLFNPIGPGLPASQAFGHFARTLAAPGPDPVVLPVGDLEARRDLLDVRDAAGAIVALASEGRPGTLYHVGSGRSVRMGDGLELLICLSDRDVRVEVDPARISPRAPRDSRADIRRIVEHIQWRPTLSWEQSLRDLWADLKSGTDARADREPSDAGDLEDLPA
jgi:nucleoside-diphosphate-sugar epimerase